MKVLGFWVGRNAWFSRFAMLVVCWNSIMGNNSLGSFFLGGGLCLVVSLCCLCVKVLGFSIGRGNWFSHFVCFIFGRGWNFHLL